MLSSSGINTIWTSLHIDLACKIWKWVIYLGIRLQVVWCSFSGGLVQLFRWILYYQKKEMASLFINNFKTPYFKFKIGSTTQHFTNLVVVAERIGQAIEVGIVNFEVIRNPSWGMVLKLGILFDWILLCHRLLKSHCQRLIYHYHSKIFNNIS